MSQPPPNEPPPPYDAALSGGYTNSSYQQQGPPFVNQGGTYPPNAPYVIEGNQEKNPQHYTPSASQANTSPPVINISLHGGYYVPEANQVSLTTQGQSPYIVTTDTAVPSLLDPPDTTTNDSNANSDSSEPSVVMGSSCFLVFSAIPIAMVVIGVLNLDKCPLDDTIPIYFILSGGIPVVIAFLIACTLAVKMKYDSVFIGIAVVLGFAHAAIQAWGCYLLFRRWNDYFIVKEYFDGTGFDMDQICNPTLFLFAFSMLVIYCILIPCAYSATKV